MTNYITKTIKNGVEANIPVTSVNWQYGDVTIQTGGNYTAGNWIDITNDEIWLDGTYEWKDYSAMQWPCSTWFHVPTKEESVALSWILTNTFSLAGNSTTMGTYLKMPRAWSRSGSTSGVIFQNEYWNYWHSSYSQWGIAYELQFTSSTLNPQDSNSYISNAYSIRPFKDSPVIPDSSWTTLYDGSSIATWAWIFHNATLWLISVSWDGYTWITIADKNLWATTVYNNWDTLSEANCGWYFQRWNNYMFPFTWTLSWTSSTKVNASAYWPWNYYNSWTFIKVSNWDSSSNKNLRWWETWVQIVSWNLVIWDQLYKIVTSTTAPASWTASNIITIVTD